MWDSPNAINMYSQVSYTNIYHIVGDGWKTNHKLMIVGIALRYCFLRHNCKLGDDHEIFGDV